MQETAKRKVVITIDGVFVKRDVVKAFERFVFFEACDKIAENIDPDCPLKEMPANLGHRTYARYSAIVGRSVLGAMYYILH